LQADLVTSMKSGDKDKLAAVRLIKSKITNKDKESGVEAGMINYIEIKINIKNTESQ
jgi:uncharacterized protein YqeY